MNLWTILIAVAIFGFLIFVHELGHYIAARIFGVKIYEFSIGMGPKLLWYDSPKTGIRYKLCMFPFGGYVSMAEAGEDDAAASDDPNALTNQRPWKRFVILAAGGFVNLFVGVLLMFSVVLASPMPSTVVASFPEEIASSEASTLDGGLELGDEILSIDGKRVRSSMEMDYEIMRRGIEPLTVVVLRNGERVTLTLTFPTEETAGQVIGTRDFYVLAVPKTVGNVLTETFSRSACTVRMVWESVFDLISGRYGMEAVSGPIGITASVSEVASYGILSLIYFVAVISINLGVVNLFPLPALDGGRLVFVLIEMIFKKPIPKKIEATVHTVGILLLLLFAVIISVMDIRALF